MSIIVIDLLGDEEEAETKKVNVRKEEESSKIDTNKITRKQVITINGEIIDV